HIRRRIEPVLQLGLAVRRDPEGLLGTLLGRVLGLDVPGVLEALERRVHLTDVERPDVAGTRLELLAQLKAIFGAFAQERQQGVPDAHVRTLRTSSVRTIRSM